MDDWEAQLKKYLPIMVLAGILLLSVVVVSLCMPLAKSIAKAKQQQKTLTQQITIAQYFLDTQGGPQGGNIHLTPPDKAEKAVDSLTSIAEKNEIELTFKEPSSQEQTQDGNQGAYTKKFFDVQATGSFKNLVLFLTAIRDMPDGILDLNKLDISSNGDYSSTITANISFVLLMANA